MWNLPPLSVTILQAWRMAGAKEVGPASRTDEISCLRSATGQQQQQQQQQAQFSVPGNIVCSAFHDILQTPRVQQHGVVWHGDMVLQTDPCLHKAWLHDNQQLCWS
jgi:hypothetical protein